MDREEKSFTMSNQRPLEAVETNVKIDLSQLTDSQKNSLVEASNFDPDRCVKSVQKSGINEDLDPNDDLNTLELLTSLNEIENEVVKS